MMINDHGDNVCFGKSTYCEDSDDDDDNNNYSDDDDDDDDWL